MTEPSPPSAETGSRRMLPNARMQRHFTTVSVLAAKMSRPTYPLRYLGVILLVVGLWRGWLQPALSHPLRATDLTVALPGGRHQPITWGLLLSISVALALVGLTPWGHRRPAWTDLAAVLSIASTAGFLLQSCLADVALQQRLRSDEIDLADLQRIVGYTIPRPSLTTLGPIPLPAPAADVLSALRSGFYLALFGAVLLSVAARAQRRAAVVRTVRARRVFRSVTAGLTIALAASIVQSANAAWTLRRAQASAAGGDDRSAVALYQRALEHGSGMENRPDLLSQYGISEVRVGTADTPAAQLASSRLQLQAGKDLTALQIVADSARRWPGETALREEFTAQAFAYLQKHGAPTPVHALIWSGGDSPVLRIALARCELTMGDNPAAIVDARAADAMAADTDVRSVALTFLAVAQSRSGDLIEGRKTLLAAVDADHDQVNVMARSILTGLYTSLPL